MSYKATHPDMKGNFILEYEDGILKSITNTHPESSYYNDWVVLMSHLIYQKNNLFVIKDKFIIEKQQGTNDRIALFCTYYMRYKNGLKYKVSPADSGKIKLVDATDALLKVYFESTTFIFQNKSISNYVKYYNELRAEAAGVGAKQIFPNKYDPDYEKTLSGPKLAAYWEHLRTIGWKNVEVRPGKKEWQQA